MGKVACERRLVPNAMQQKRFKVVVPIGSIIKCSGAPG